MSNRLIIALGLSFLFFLLFNTDCSAADVFKETSLDVPALKNQAGQAFSQEDRQRTENLGSVYIRALNSGDAENCSKAVKDIFSQEILQRVGEARLVGQMSALQSRVGEMEYHHSELAEYKAGDRFIRVLHVYAKSKGAKGWKDLQFRIEPNPPYKLSELAFVADVAEPIYLPNFSITEREALEWLNGYIEKLIADNDLSGSVMIAQGDKPIFERVYGFADSKRSVKIARGTRFNLASGSKMFTAIAVAQLVEKGKLKYSDSLSKFFPDFPDAAFARKATIHHLLTHTSGVKEYWTDEYVKNWHEISQLKQMLPWVYKVGVGFEPGSKFEYSNSNFILAGLIVEKVSQTDYYSYVRKNICEPLDMTVTDFYLRDGSTANLAEPLKKGLNGWETADQCLRGTSAGGCYSQADDMLKFARGLVGGKLVSRDSLAMLTTSKMKAVNEAIDYGYGFILGDNGGASSFGHGGIAMGTNFEFRYFPLMDITFVIFCNQDNGAFDDLRKNIIKLITGDR